MRGRIHITLYKKSVQRIYFRVIFIDFSWDKWNCQLLVSLPVGTFQRGLVRDAEGYIFCTNINLITTHIKNLSRERLLFHFFLFVVPDQAPSIITSYNTSSTSLYLAWLQIPNSSFKGVPQGYALIYSDSNNTKKSMFVCYEASNATIHNLKKYEKYSIKIAAFTVKGIGVFSDIVEVYTDEDGKLFVLSIYHQWKSSFKILLGLLLPWWTTHGPRLRMVAMVSISHAMYLGSKTTWSELIAIIMPIISLSNKCNTLISTIISGLYLHLEIFANILVITDNITFAYNFACSPINRQVTSHDHDFLNNIFLLTCKFVVSNITQWPGVRRFSNKQHSHSICRSF